MQGAPDPIVALERARWLDQLIRAVNEAQRIAWTLGVAEGDCTEARELYGRLEEVRNELELLRTGNWAAVRTEIDPTWLENFFGSFIPITGIGNK